MDIDVDTRIVVYAAILIFAVFFRFMWDFGNVGNAVDRFVFSLCFTGILTCFIALMILGIYELIKKSNPDNKSFLILWLTFAFTLFTVAGAFYPVFWDFLAGITSPMQRLGTAMGYSLLLGLVIAVVFCIVIWKGIKAAVKDKAPVSRQTIPIDMIIWIFSLLLFIGLYYLFAYALLGTENSPAHIIGALMISFVVAVCMWIYIKTITRDSVGARSQLVFDPELWGIALFVLIGGFYPFMSCLLSLFGTIPERAATTLVCSGVFALLMMMILIIGVTVSPAIPAGETH